MEVNESRYFMLLQRYVADNISKEEADELFDMIGSDPYTADRILRESLGEQLMERANKCEIPDSLSLRLRARVAASLSGNRVEIPLADLQQRRVKGAGSGVTRRSFSLGWVRYAAAVLLVAFISAMLMLRSGENAPVQLQDVADKLAIVQSDDRQPGTNKALLTLSDGTVVSLDSATDGELGREGGVRVLKRSNGEILYDGASTDGDQRMRYNTMTTPKGGQYQLTLHEGTRVWLNSESSLRFPVRFSGNERTVFITGEVYFEVAHNETMPFRVNANGVDVKVLGTSFNINSYNNEKYITTTLLSGGVEIGLRGEQAVLRPGQQALVGLSAKENTVWGKHGGHVDVPKPGISVIDHVNIDQIVAWKNGRFDFNGADLPAVMRQLERWYDIEVRYQGDAPQDIFRGELPKNLALSQVLKILGKMEVKFKLEGRTLVVTR